MKLVYFGTPEISAEILQKLFDAGLNIVGLVTQPDRPRGRKGTPSPSPVAALAHDLPLLKPASCKDLAFQEELARLEPDIAVVVAFGQILPRAVLDIPKFGCINVHASLLPKYRGAAPMQRALMNGDKVTGVTIMEMVEKMDAGDILLKKEIPIFEGMLLSDLEKAVIKKGSEGLIEVLGHLDAYPGKPQDPGEVSFAQKITKEECAINWSLTPAEIVNHVRGLSPRPGAYTFVQVDGKKLRLKVLDARVGSEGLSFHNVELVHVQLEGGRAMDASELLRGIGMLRLDK